MAIIIQQLVIYLDNLRKRFDESRTIFEKLKKSTIQNQELFRNALEYSQTRIVHQGMQFDGEVKQAEQVQNMLVQAHKQLQNNKGKLMAQNEEAKQLKSTLEETLKQIEEALRTAKGKQQHAVQEERRCNQEHQQAEQEKNKAYQINRQIIGEVVNLSSRIHSLESELNSVERQINAYYSRPHSPNHPPPRPPSHLIQRENLISHELSQLERKLGMLQQEQTKSERQLDQKTQLAQEKQQALNEARREKTLRDSRLSEISNIYSRINPLQGEYSQSQEKLTKMSEFILKGEQHIQKSDELNQKLIQEREQIKASFEASNKLWKERKGIFEKCSVQNQARTVRFQNRDRDTENSSQEIKRQHDLLRNHLV